MVGRVLVCVPSLAVAIDATGNTCAAADSVGVEPRINVS